MGDPDVAAVARHERHRGGQASTGAHAHHEDLVFAHAQLGGVLLQPEERSVAVVHGRGVGRLQRLAVVRRDDDAVACLHEHPVHGAELLGAPHRVSPSVQEEDTGESGAPGSARRPVDAHAHPNARVEGIDPALLALEARHVGAAHPPVEPPREAEEPLRGPHQEACREARQAQLRIDALERHSHAAASRIVRAPRPPSPCPCRRPRTSRRSRGARRVA